MNRRTRPLWIVLGCLVIAVVLAAAVLGVQAYRAGMLVVRVQESGPHGSDIAIQIPAILVPMALRVIPDQPLREAAQDAARWVPAAKTAARALMESPDFVVVQMDSPGETVNISKRDSRLIVDVSSMDETVYVALPLGILDSVLKRLEGLARST